MTSRPRLPSGPTKVNSTRRWPPRLIWAVTLCIAVTACNRKTVAPVDRDADVTMASTATPHTEYHVLQDRPDRLLVQLPNRMIVLAAEVRTAPVVSAQVWIKTGSIYEQEHTGAGLSHFLEHLISGGSTSNRNETQSNAILAAIGAQTNAATGLDTVHYYINTTSAHADQAVDLLSDWMQHSLIPQDEYERERSVIQREFEMGQGEPGRILWKLTQQARYDTHPARHPTIGYLDEFLTVNRDEIYDFYKRMYVPNNMVFVVVGDIDKRVVVDQITALWTDAKPQPLPEIRLPREPKRRQLDPSAGIADIDQPRLRLAWPGTRLAGPDDYALDLLAGILGQGESSRLVRTVRDEQRAAFSIDSYNLSFAWGEGFFGIDADVAVPPVPQGVRTTAQAWRDQHIAITESSIFEQVKRIVDDGVTDSELARAKRKTLASVVYSAQSAQALATRMARDLIGTGDPDYLKRYAQAIQTVTAEQVRQAGQRILDPSRAIRIRLLPQGDDQKPTPLSRPAADPSKSNSADEERIELDNKTIVNQLAKLQHSDIADITSVHVEPIQLHRLPNGLRVLIGRSNVVPAVAMRIYQLGGHLADPNDHVGLANAMASMQIKGTHTRSAQQIAQQIEDLGAVLSTHCGYNSVYSQAVCLRDDWGAALDLLADVTLNPAFREEEWDKLRPRIVAAVDRQTDTWNGELRQHFRKAYFADHPWATTPLGKRQVVAALSTADLQSFHESYLGASTTVLAVFGDVNAQQVIDRVERLFSDMLPQSPQVFRAVEPVAAQGGLFQYKTSKPLAAVQIGLGPITRRQSPDYPAVRVLANVMSRFPSGWLEQELRGRGPGLVYAVGAGSFTGLVPGYFAVLFNTQPNSVDQAMQRAMGVVDRARTTLVDDTSLAAAKAKVLTDEFLFKQTNSARAEDAALNVLYKLGLDEPQRFRQVVTALDAQQLQTVAARYLRNPVAVVISHEPVDEELLRSSIAPTEPNEE